MAAVLRVVMLIHQRGYEVLSYLDRVDHGRAHVIVSEHVPEPL